MDLASKLLQKSWPDWECVRLIGEGAYGKVYEIRKEDYGVVSRAALKVITIPQSQSDLRTAISEGLDRESFRELVVAFSEEIAMMCQLQGYSNIVSYKDHKILEHEGEIGWDILIQMELLTPLWDHWQNNKVTEQNVIQLGCDICRALELCERNNIIHRDIKPENIFVNVNGDYKLGDFGVAKTVDRTTGMSQKGTPPYMAPEVYRGKKYNFSVDIYSLGMVLYILCNKNRAPFLPLPPTPIRIKDKEDAMARRIDGEALPKPQNCSEQLWRVIQKATAYEAKDRYSCAVQMREALEDCQMPANRPAKRAWTGNVKDTVIPEDTTPIPKTDDNQTIGGQRPGIPGGKKRRLGLKVTIGCIAAVLALAIGFGVWAWSGRGQQEPEKDVEPNPEQAEQVQEPEQESEIVTELTPEEKAYKAAKALFDDGSYLEAARAFDELGDYSDSRAQAIASWDIVTRRKTIAAGYSIAIAVTESGKTIGEAEWENVIAVDAKSVTAIGLCADGTVLTTADVDVSAWSDIVAVAAGDYHVVGVRSDGTVVAAGDNEYGQCDVNEWTDVIKVVATWSDTYGLRSDGTVLSTGLVSSYYDDTDSWRYIVDIAAGNQHAIGLRQDGTIITFGHDAETNEEIETWVQDWTNIVAIASGETYVVGLCSDGTAVAGGQNFSGRCDVSDWTDIVDLSAGGLYTMGLKSDGTVMEVGNQSDIEKWSDLRVPARIYPAPTAVPEEDPVSVPDIEDLTNGYWYQYDVQGGDILEYVFSDDGTVQVHSITNGTSEYSSDPVTLTYSMQPENIVVIEDEEWLLDWTVGRLWGVYEDSIIGIAATYLKYYSEKPSVSEMMQDSSEYWVFMDDQYRASIADAPVDDTYNLYQNKEIGLNCYYPKHFEMKVSDNVNCLRRYVDMKTYQSIEFCYCELDYSIMPKDAMQQLIDGSTGMTVEYSASGEGWYAISMKDDYGVYYRKALFRANNTQVAWFDFYIPNDSFTPTNPYIEYMEDNFSFS